jgi:hypothetical protein
MRSTQWNVTFRCDVEERLKEISRRVTVGEPGPHGVLQETAAHLVSHTPGGLGTEVFFELLGQDVTQVDAVVQRVHDHADFVVVERVVANVAYGICSDTQLTKTIVANGADNLAGPALGIVTVGERRPGIGICHCTCGKRLYEWAVGGCAGSASLFALLMVDLSIVRKSSVLVPRALSRACAPHLGHANAMGTEAYRQVQDRLLTRG